MSNLVDHARYELERINEEPYVIEQYLTIVQAFVAMGHSGSSAAHCTYVLNRLLQFEPLSDITNNPDEWYYHGPEYWDGETGVWQNKRKSSAFSHDGGKTHYLLEEGISEGDRIMHVTKDDIQKDVPTEESA